MVDRLAIQPRVGGARLTRRRGGVLACLLLVLGSQNIVGGQLNYGSLYGVVRDRSGAAIPGAMVTLSNQETGVGHGTHWTTDSGQFHFNTLPAGPGYVVRVRLSGYKAAVTEPLVVNVSSETGIFVTLDVGAVTEEIIVPASSAVSETFSLRVASLALTGASLDPLTTLTTPAPAFEHVEPPQSGFSAVRPVGQRVESISVDDMNLGYSGRGAAPLPGDSIQIVSKGEPFSAAYAGVLDSHLSVVTRSGASEFHGGASRAWTHEAFAARNVFDAEGRVGDALRVDLLSGSLGGPVLKDRAWFFAASERRTQRVDSVSLVSRIAPNELGAALDSIGGEERLNPVSRTLLPLLTADTHLAPVSSEGTGRRIATVVKGSMRFTDQQSVDVQYVDGDSTSVTPVALDSTQSRVAGSADTRAVRANYTWVPRANLVNLLQLSYDRTREASQVGEAPFDATRLGVMTTAGSDTPGLPLIRIAGYDPAGPPSGIPSRRSPVDRIRLTNSFVAIFGLHDLKAGVDVSRIDLHSLSESGSRGSFYFDSLERFLLGDVAVGRLSAGSAERRLRQTGAAAYVQDTMRFGPSLSLMLGLRWDYAAPPEEKTGRLVTFLPENGGLVMVGGSAAPTLYQRDLDNFAPRLGLSWQPDRRRRVSVSAGYGIYYVFPSMEIALGQSAPNSLAGGPAYSPIGPDPVPSVSRYDFRWQPNTPIFGISGESGQPFDVSVIDPNLTTPRLHYYSGSVQVRPTERTLITAELARSHGSGLAGLRDVNQPTPGPAETSDARRPFASAFPDLRAINVLESRGLASGTKVTVGFEQRTDRASLQSTYTFSRATDDVSDAIETRPGTAFPQDSRTLAGERGPSSFQAQHHTTIRVIYRPPSADVGGPLATWMLRNWVVAAAFVAQSGYPFTVGTRRNPSGTRDYADRPDLVGDPRPQDRRGGVYLDAAAFSDAYQNRFGTLARNTFEGPSFSTWDLSFTKSNEVRKGLKLEFKVEVFNILNRANYALPGSFLSDGPELFGRARLTRDVAAGQAATAGGPQSAMVTLRLVF